MGDLSEALTLGSLKFCVADAIIKGNFSGLIALEIEAVQHPASNYGGGYQS
jgi:hypothetical protein